MLQLCNPNYVDGSANQQRCGAGLVLTMPYGVKFEYVICFNFRTSNNEVEYDVFLVGLCLAKDMGAR